MFGLKDPLVFNGPALGLECMAGFYVGARNPTKGLMLTQEVLYHYFVLCLCVCQPDTNQGSLGRGTQIEKILQSDWPVYSL